MCVRLTVLSVCDEVGYQLRHVVHPFVCVCVCVRVSARLTVLSVCDEVGYQLWHVVHPPCVRSLSCCAHTERGGVAGAHC